MSGKKQMIWVIVLLLAGAALAAAQPAAAGPAIQAEATPTATPNVNFGQPQLIVQEASTDPALLQPGSPFTLAFVLANRGDRNAINVRIDLPALDLAMPRQGSSLAIVDQIKGKKSAGVELPLVLSKTAAPGYHTLQLDLTYIDTAGRSFTTSQSVGLEVGGQVSSQPLVLLEEYHTRPEALSPGDTFALGLTLLNAGKTGAQQVTVTLGGEDGSGLKPFAILNSGNSRYLPALLPGEKGEVELSLILDGAAASGVYNLPVTLAFDDEKGERQSQSQVLNLVASRRPQLQIGFYEPVETGEISQTIKLPIEVVNIGTASVNLSTVEIAGEGMDIETGSSFIGALDGGTTGSFDASIIPRQSGSLSVEVTAHYLDDFNRPQVFTQTLQVMAKEPAVQAAPGGAKAAETGPQNKFLQILRGLVGLGS